MHMLAFLYPNKPGFEFDTEHWRDVHLPLGLGLTDKHLGLRPKKVVLFGPGVGHDLTQATSPFSAIAAVFFDDAETVKKFATLFEYEEAARRLSEDFPNYTPGPPGVMVSQVEEITDIDGMVEKFKRGEKG